MKTRYQARSGESPFAPVLSFRGPAVERTSEPRETHQSVQFVARLLRGKPPEELERRNVKTITSAVVLPGLADADEAEGLARGSTDREVVGHVIVFQVLVVLAAINDLPRALASAV